MKWRNAFIYLAVLALLGGYYYYFEVIKTEQKQAAEKKAKQIFSVQADNIQALEISPKAKKSVVLKKENQWKVVDPVSTDADLGASELFLKALANLEAEREVVAEPDSLKPYGLQEPSLKVRFQAGDQWFDLLVGDKSPSGGGYYAKAGEKANIFLLPESAWSALNKGLDDLRKKELFTFQTSDVKSLDINWNDGNRIHVQKDDGAGGWKIPEAPEEKVKTSKVENTLDQLHWARAQSFVEDEAKNLDSHGLNPPYVTVRVQLEDGKTAELLLAGRKPDQRQVAAVSSELPGVVMVNTALLDDLPKETTSLEDRSILSAKPEDVKELSWKIGHTHGHVVAMGENKWGVKEGDAQPSELKESWRVNSVLWNLGEMEYSEKVNNPTLPKPEQPFAKLEIGKADKSTTSLEWEKPSPDGAEPVTLWIGQGGSSTSVRVDSEKLRRVSEDIEHVIQPEAADRQGSQEAGKGS